MPKRQQKSSSFVQKTSASKSSASGVQLIDLPDDILGEIVLALPTLQDFINFILSCRRFALLFAETKVISPLWLQIFLLRRYQLDLDAASSFFLRFSQAYHLSPTVIKLLSLEGLSSLTADWKELLIQQAKEYQLFQQEFAQYKEKEAKGDIASNLKRGVIPSSLQNLWGQARARACLVSLQDIVNHFRGRGGETINLLMGYHPMVISEVSCFVKQKDINAAQQFVRGQMLSYLCYLAYYRFINPDTRTKVLFTTKKHLPAKCVEIMLSYGNWPQERLLELSILLSYVSKGELVGFLNKLARKNPNHLQICLGAIEVHFTLYIEHLFSFEGLFASQNSQVLRMLVSHPYFKLTNKSILKLLSEAFMEISGKVDPKKNPRRKIFPAILNDVTNPVMNVRGWIEGFPDLFSSITILQFQALVSWLQEHMKRFPQIATPGCIDAFGNTAEHLLASLPSALFAQPDELPIMAANIDRANNEGVTPRQIAHQRKDDGYMFCFNQIPPLVTTGAMSALIPRSSPLFALPLDLPLAAPAEEAAPLVTTGAMSALIPRSSPLFALPLDLPLAAPAEEAISLDNMEIESPETGKFPMLEFG